MPTPTLTVWRWLSRVRGLQGFLLRRLNTHFIVGCTGVIMDDAGRVLLFHHTYRDRYAWGTPGGWLRRGEQAPEALVREIREEAGLAVEPLAPLAVDTDPGTALMEIVWLARPTGAVGALSAEIDDVRWFGLDDALPGNMKPFQARVVGEARRLHRAGRLPEVSLG